MMGGQVTQTEIQLCGAVPDTAGWGTCTRQRGHVGPCAHPPLSVSSAFGHAVALGRLAEWFDGQGWQPAAAACRAGSEAVGDVEFFRTTLKRFGWDPDGKTAETWLAEVSSVYRNQLAAVRRA